MTTEENLKKIIENQPTKPEKRGKYIRKTKPKKEVVGWSLADTSTLEVPPVLPPTHRAWPTITIKRRKFSNENYLPVCFQAFKLLHAINSMYFEQPFLSVLQEIGVKVVIQDA